MKFYSGFSLCNESNFFSDYLETGMYSVAGFSYGAILAAEHALASSERIDTLQLFAPAFFQSRPERYRQFQMKAFLKDPEAYVTQFIVNCFAPYAVQEIERVAGTAETLEQLLNYAWTEAMLKRLVEKGIDVQVFLGGQDRIIESDKARDFFTPYATVTYLKAANHFLQEHE